MTKKLFCPCALGVFCLGESIIHIKNSICFKDTKGAVTELWFYTNCPAYDRLNPALKHIIKAF